METPPARGDPKAAFVVFLSIFDCLYFMVYFCLYEVEAVYLAWVWTTVFKQDKISLPRKETGLLGIIRNEWVKRKPSRLQFTGREMAGYLFYWGMTAGRRTRVKKEEPRGMCQCPAILWFIFVLFSYRHKCLGLLHGTYWQPAGERRQSASGPLGLARPAGKMSLTLEPLP